MNTYVTPLTEVYNHKAFRLLCFQHVNGVDPVLIIPPMAGFNNQIIDWSEGGSIVQTMMTSGRGVYAIEWKSAGMDRAGEDYNKIMLHVSGAMGAAEGDSQDINALRHLKSHLVGVCHGGVLSAMFAAIKPSFCASLTIAGSPIDTSTRSPALYKAQCAPMAMYEATVAMCGGIMPGELLLSAWKYAHPDVHFLNRFLPGAEDNAKMQRFYRWYNEEKLDLAGKAFLQFIEGVYKNNDLMEGRFKVGDSTVDLGNINCPVYVIYGEDDDVVPPAHTLGICNHVDVAMVIPRQCGHIKLFNDRYERSGFKVVADSIAV